MKSALKRLLLRLLGKEEQPIVVSFASGDPHRAETMRAEALRLLPDLRHFVVEAQPGNALALWWRLRRRFAPYRIGMAPVLFDNTPQHRHLRLAAFLLAPFKILAYNAAGERHHLHPSCPISSWLFFRGIPLDRIHLRPRWLPLPTHDRSTIPDDPSFHPGRLPRLHVPRVAVLTPFLPWPLSHGGAVRMHALLRQLAKSADVYLIAFREEPKPDMGPLLEFLTGIALIGKPRYREPRWSSLQPPEVREYRSPPMLALLQRIRRDYHIDIVQVEFTQLAAYPGDILVEHDITFDLYRQILDRNHTLAALWDWLRWRLFETRAARRFRRVITMSPKDAALLQHPGARTIPNGVDLSRFQPAPETPGRHLLFIGSFRHFPNVLAFQFLWHDVLPRLNDVHLTVVAGPDPERYAPLPRDPRLTLHAFVADVRPLYHAANLVLVPTLVSAGTNLKVLEAMAMQRAVVSTTSGCGGIPVTPGVEAAIADGAEAYAQAIETLLNDTPARLRMASLARDFVQKHFDWDTLGEMQREVVTEILPERIEVRKGGAVDLPRVRALQADALPSSKWDPIHYLSHEFYTAYYDGTLAGFLVARRTADDEREILNIAVAESYRRLRIGERLLRTMMENPVKGEIFLEVRESNTGAQRLYEMVGFATVGKRPNYYDDPPETALIMRIKL
ncbi:MAG: ribosomal protein S18-alanine N-acetyltransferase [Bryobacterales bacterium]|nr:ribosomal protein S18-alanine N-acetyltransferase [Bryobacterales bacterium]